MSKTLMELRTHTRVYLDEASSADWNDSQVDREVNYAYQEVVSAVIDVYEDYYRKKVTRNVRSGISEYSLPSDFLKMRRIEISFKEGNDRTKATRFNFDSLVRPWDSAVIGLTSRPAYDLTGKYLRILPVPSENVDSGLYVYYIYNVPELVENTDTIDIPNPDRYGNLIVLAAAAQLLRKGQQEEAVANSYINEFQLGLEKMKRELKDRIADGAKTIVDMQGDNLDFSNM